MTLPNRLWKCIEIHLSPCSSDLAAGRFNPWYSTNPELDLPNADALRRNNLKSYLNLFTNSPQILAIGEAPGWRGCRFSGVPFTSEAQLVGGELPFKGHQTSKTSTVRAEQSADVFWSEIKSYAADVFVWNAYPLHPHKPDHAASNRTPNPAELRTFWPLLQELHDIIQPRIIVAIGRRAEMVMHKKDWLVSYIRHPAHGGADEFRGGMRKIERLPS